MRKAQSTIEYAVAIAVVVMALVAMNMYVRGAVQSNLKMLQERVNAVPNR